MIQEHQQQIKETFDSKYPYRFRFQDQANWRQYLQHEGFVVIANYLDEDVCQQFVDQFWGIMETLSFDILDRNDKSTQKLGKNYPFVMHGGMIQYIGHSEPQWKLRKLCKPIFQKLWECEKVKTSFDGFCFMNGIRNYKKTDQNSFLHTDQSPRKNYLWSYQGVMCLTKNEEQDGGFVCVPRSHLYHRLYFSDKGLLKRKDDWYKFPDEDKTEEPLCNDIKVNNEAGDFILFDSRTFHCNSKPASPSLRVCTYICMIPETKVPADVKAKKKKAIKQRRTSTHHPGDGFRTFPVLPRYINERQKFLSLVKEINNYPLQTDKDIIDLI